MSTELKIPITVTHEYVGKPEADDATTTTAEPMPVEYYRPSQPARQDVARNEPLKMSKMDLEKTFGIELGGKGSPTDKSQEEAASVFRNNRSRDELMDYRRQKTDARTQEEMNVHGTPQKALADQRQLRDEDYAARQERQSEAQAKREANRQEMQQLRNEDYAAKQERREEQQADRETKRQEIQQQRNEDYTAKQERQSEAQARREADRQERRQQRDEDFAAKQERREEQQAQRADPYFQASQKRAQDLQREQTKAAYDEMYGKNKPQKSTTDQALDAAQQIRGSLGGIFGPMAGAALDMMTAVRRHQQADQKTPLRHEAEMMNRTLKMPQGSASATRSSGQPPSFVGAGPPPPPSPPSGPPPSARGAAMGAAEIAGPIMAAVVAAAEAVKAFNRAVGGMVQGAGDAATSLMQFKDGSERFQELSQATQSVSDKILLLVPPIGIMGTVTAQTIGSIGRFDEAAKSSADRLAQYHGGLASQVAMQDVTQMVRDINRAQRFGNSLAHANEARFAAEQRVADVMERFMPPLLKLAENTFGMVERIADTADRGVEQNLRWADDALQYLQRLMPAVGPLQGVIASIRDIIQEALGTNNAATSDALWAQFLSLSGPFDLQSTTPMPNAPTSAITGS